MLKRDSECCRVGFRWGSLGQFGIVEACLMSPLSAHTPLLWGEKQAIRHFSKRVVGRYASVWARWVGVIVAPVLSSTANSSSMMKSRRCKPTATPLYRIST